MPITVEIVRGGKALYFCCTDPWSARDVLDAAETARKVYDTTAHPVPSLLDMRGARTIPSDILRIRHSPTLTHAHAGGIVVIGANRLAKTVSDAIHTIINRPPAYFASSEAEGWALLNQLIETADES
jgi:hypothetical protein